MDKQIKSKEINISPVVRDLLEKYILVKFPEIQNYMEHPRWHECICCISTEEHPCPDGAYMVPESLYKEMLYKLED